METWVTEHTVHVYENFIYFLKEYIIMDKSRKTEKNRNRLMVNRNRKTVLIGVITVNNDN